MMLDRKARLIFFFFNLKTKVVLIDLLRESLPLTPPNKGNYRNREHLHSKLNFTEIICEINYLWKKLSISNIAIFAMSVKYAHLWFLFFTEMPWGWNIGAWQEVSWVCRGAWWGGKGRVHEWVQFYDVSFEYSFMMSLLYIRNLRLRSSPLL